MLGRYDRIDLVRYDDNSIGYLLTGYNVPKDFEVDIEADCYFNTEFEVVERKTVKTLKNINDLLDFTKLIDCNLNARFNGTYLPVGGEKDCYIFSNLDYCWREDYE